jgi:S-adenosylmethionine:tRNA ribosyltransferase-isomerase
LSIDFSLPAELEAHDPPEARGTARDGVRMLVSRAAADAISHHEFGELPRLLLPGDLIVVNTSGTLPAEVRAGRDLAVHFSTPLPDGCWLVELRTIDGPATIPNAGGVAGEAIRLPAGVTLALIERVTARLWRARLSVAVLPYLLRHGVPIRYSYVRRAWPLAAYQTVFATRPGSAEMPSASRPFTPEVVTRLVARGIRFAPLTLDTGVSSLEGDEEPYPEPYDVPPATARLVNLTRREGGRVIAAGTTVVRALETAARVRPAGNGDPAGPLDAAGPPGMAGPPDMDDDGRRTGRDGLVAASAGWTGHIVTLESGVLAVDGLLTGLHEPRSSHLRMLEAFAGPDLLSRCYEAAIEGGYLWHEFGDVHLLLP